jgi:hypothetical protein
MTRVENSRQMPLGAVFFWDLCPFWYGVAVAVWERPRGNAADEQLGYTG